MRAPEVVFVQTLNYLEVIHMYVALSLMLISMSPADVTKPYALNNSVMELLRSELPIHTLAVRLRKEGAVSLDSSSDLNISTFAQSLLRNIPIANGQKQAILELDLDYANRIASLRNELFRKNQSNESINQAVASLKLLYKNNIQAFRELMTPSQLRQFDTNASFVTKAVGAFLDTRSSSNSSKQSR